MFHFRHLAAVPALVLLMGGAAHAALTVDQVWTSWKDGATQIGLTLSAATESNAGGVLTLNGVTMARAGQQGGLTISDLVLTEQGDGTVLIKPGDSIAFNVGDAAEGAKAGIAHQGLTLVASEGAQGGISYDFAADTLAVDFSAVQPGYSFVEGQAAKPVTSSGKIALEALKGVYADTPGENRTFGLSLTGGKTVMDMTSDNPDMQMKTSSNTMSESLAVDFGLTLPSGITLGAIQSAADFGTALQQGLAVTLHVEQGASTGAASQEDQFFPYTMTMTSQPGLGDLVLNKDVFRVTSGGGGAAVDLTTQALPAPVKLSFGPMQVDMLSPVMSGETAGDYGLTLKLAEFTLNDDAWNLFDPQAILVRDPFDLSIDVSGKAKVDWIALMVADETGQQPPTPAPETLNITDISLKLAGAAANAVGAFTFDNSMGFPMPLGTADVTVTGANQLIDGLIKTGLLQEEDATGARMMMAAFMKPGADAGQAALRSSADHTDPQDGQALPRGASPTRAVPPWGRISGPAPRPR
jgi:hypothetical protein